MHSTTPSRRLKNLGLNFWTVRTRRISAATSRVSSVETTGFWPKSDGRSNSHRKQSDLRRRPERGLSLKMPFLPLPVLDEHYPAQALLLTGGVLPSNLQQRRSNVPVLVVALELHVPNLITSTPKRTDRGRRPDLLPSAPPILLGCVRRELFTLRYFVPVVEELRHEPVDAAYVRYLRSKLSERLRPKPTRSKRQRGGTNRQLQLPW